MKRKEVQNGASSFLKLVQHCLQLTIAKIEKYFQNSSNFFDLW